MKVVKLEELLGTEREVQSPDGWTSVRFLLKKDGMGFSFHETTFPTGLEVDMWYKHHLEAVYCIEGEGELEVLPDGPTYAIRPGTLYALDGHEKHHLRAHKDLRMICVFTPALTGAEVHDEEGVYPILTPEDATPGGTGKRRENP